MKKKFNMLAAAVVMITLLVGCAIAMPKTSPPVMCSKAPSTAVEENYTITVINKTSDIAVVIVCVLPYPPSNDEECVVMNVLVAPEPWVDKFKKDGRFGKDVKSKQLIYLAPGKYIFFMIAYDLRTGKTDESYNVFTVEADGQLVFCEKSISVRNI